MRKKMLSEAKLLLEIEVKGPTLVKSGEAGLLGPDMAFVRTRAGGDQDGQVFFPGTGLKGVFRSHVERLARTLAKTKHPVCLPYERGPGPEQSCGERFKGRDKPEEKPSIYRDECLACRMFGSLKYKGRVFINDAYCMPDSRPKLEIRDGVAIDRKTGGAAGRAKYDLEVMTEGRFATTVTLDNFESWQLGALGIVLDELAAERVRLGSGTSRGLGHVRGELTSAELRYPSSHDGTYCGIAHLVTEEEKAAYGLAGGTKSGLLDSGQSDGIWKLYRLEGENLRALMSHAREDFLEFLGSYRWDGGPQ